MPKRKINSSRIACLAWLILILFSLNVDAQGIKGKVIDASTKQPISFASITIAKGSQTKAAGVSADVNGEFFIVVLSPPPYILQVSRVGYITRTVSYDSLNHNAIIELQEGSITLQSFEISGEKITEEELKQPVDIVRATQRDIQLSPSFNHMDMVGNLKGVDLTTQSTVINSVNTRGFNSSINPRFRQFVDGMDSQAPGFGFSLGNLVGPSVLDIEGLELIPGPTTASYGPSAMNGVLMVHTKNPLDYTGLSVAVKGATISLEETNKEFFRLNNFISEVSARYAVNWRDKVGFKISGTYLNGVDFHARNYTNKGPGKSFDFEYSKYNQSIDGINKYGDDRASILVGRKLSGIDTVFYVTRNGIREEDLTDYEAKNWKYNAQLDFKLNDNLKLSLVSQYAIADAMITHVDRFKLKDFEIQQHKLELRSNSFLARAYVTRQNAGNSFNVGSLADMIVRAAKPDDVFIQEFGEYFNGHPIMEKDQLFFRAREFANNNTASGYLPRFIPGTERYDSLKSAIISSIIPGEGVGLYDESKLYNVDVEYSLKEKQEFFNDLRLGANYRMNDPNTNGIAFPDSENNDITNYEYGIYGEAKKAVDDRTELTLSLRYDKNENFKAKLSERLSVVHQLDDKNYIRASALRGYRFPTIVEQFQDQNLGDKRLIGGLSSLVDSYELENNSFYLSGLREYNNLVFNDVNVNEVRYQNARLNHSEFMRQQIVAEGTFGELKPEQITTFEIGYRGVVQDRRIFELTVYRNYYTNFIGTIRLVKPRTSPSIDLARAIDQANQSGSSDIIFVTDNSEKPIITQGVDFLYDITGTSGVHFSVNASYADIIQDSDDPLVPGFNTAPFKWNVTLGHRRISRSFGASLSWRSRTTFDWQSPFADGPVDDFSTFDLQLSYKIPEIGTLVRVGANNVHNIDQYNTYGGPEINAFYYISLTYDPFQAR